MEMYVNLLWGIFFIGKQKIVLFLKYRENSWEFVASALNIWYSVSSLKLWLPLLISSSMFDISMGRLDGENPRRLSRLVAF
jgi:hypothetical protein